MTCEMLPFEIWLLIIEYLTPYDLLELGLVNKQHYKSLFQNDMIWRIMLNRDWFDTQVLENKHTINPKCAYFNAVSKWRDLEGVYNYNSFKFKIVISMDKYLVVRRCVSIYHTNHVVEEAPRFIKQGSVHTDQTISITDMCAPDNYFVNVDRYRYEKKKENLKKNRMRKKYYHKMLVLTEKRIGGIPKKPLYTHPKQRRQWMPKQKKHNRRIAW